MDKIRKTGIMKKVSKSRICQNLSKYQDRIVNLSTLSVLERRIVSPSPPFDLASIVILPGVLKCFGFLGLLY